MDGDDMALVSEYARTASEEAFAELVARHLDLVHSVARRRVTDEHLAQDVTQAVFLLLSRKAASLGPKTIVPAWLCRTAHFVAGDALKLQRRRMERESQVMMEQHLLADSSEPGSNSQAQVWSEIAPVLEEVLSELGEADHDAIVLRFFQGKDMKEVGSALGVSENAAKTRICRATDKLRRSFLKRGITASSAAITAAVSAHSIAAAPTGLAQIVTGAVAQGGILSPSATALTKSALKLMALSKIKTTAITGALLILLLGGAATAYQHWNATPPPNPFTFAGYATPEATVQTMVWAAGTGDFDKFLDCLSPEERTRMMSRIGNRPKADLSRKGIALAQAMAGYRIVEREEISPDEVRLHISATPSPDGLHSGRNITILKRIGSEWKRAGDIDE